MKGVLPNWLERWLGIEPASPGQGTVWELEHSWTWAPSLTLLVVAAAIAWVAFFYHREAGSRAYRSLLAILRLTAVLLVFVMLAEPTITLRRTGLPTVVVAVDDSDSMSIEDKLAGKAQKIVRRQLQQAGLVESTRLNVAKALLSDRGSQLVRKLERDYKVKLYFVSDDARLQPGDRQEMNDSLRKLEARGTSSRLGDAVSAILRDSRGAPPAAIVLLSDGITTEGEPLSAAARAARAKGVPIFAIGLGSDVPVRDLELSDLLVDEVVFVDDIVNFEAKLRTQGAQGREVEVTLRREDNPEILARTKASIDQDGQPQTVRLAYRPTEAGQFEYVVEVTPLEDEVDPTNNLQKRSVYVRKDRIRVLLAQAYPSYEFRYLANMLARDKTVELKTVLQDADLEYAEIDASVLRMFPATQEELFEYDVLILGDFNPALLGTPGLANVQAFVERKGGGIALIAGPKYMPVATAGTPLERLLPFELANAAVPDDASLDTPFKLRPTDIGLTMPHLQLGDSLAESQKIWSQLPELYWLLKIQRTKPAVRVLAEGAPEGAGGSPLPVIMLQYFGAGRILFHATDETWRWRYRVGDALFARYWGQAIRMLSRSKLMDRERGVELTVEQPEFRRGEAVSLRARFLDERLAPATDDGVEVVVEHAGQPNERMTLTRSSASRGLFEGTFTAMGEGRYHARLAAPATAGKAPSVDFRVTAPPGERVRTAMDVAELKAAAAMSGGRFYPSSNALSLLSELPPGRQVPIEPLPPRPLWNHWWMMVALVGVLGAEWILRKRKGML